MTSPTLIEQAPAERAAIRDTRGFARAAILFVLTLGSTTMVGMRYMQNFQLGQAPLSTDADILPYAWVWRHLGAWASGLPFSLTLIGILLAHEFGHYFACRAYGVDCSLPFMLPAPSLSGTFGAVIKLRSRVRTRNALIVIGASGPIAGFAVALVAVGAGLRLSTYAASPVMRHVQAPLLISAMQRAIGGGHALGLLVPHPVLTASWLGLLITALNLIPAGQLDGGHILYAVSPRAYRIVSRIVIATLLVLGVVAWSGWLLWGVILALPVMRHPKVPEQTRLTRRQMWLLPLCLLLAALSWTFQPFKGYSLIDVTHKASHRYR